MLFKGVPGYFVEPDGQLSCMDCSIDYINENEYAATDEVAEIASILSSATFIRVRRWVSTCRDADDVWLQELGEEA